MVDDRTATSDSWDLILTQPLVHLHRTPPVHPLSDSKVQISLNPMVVIAPEFKGTIMTLLSFTKYL